MAGTNDQREDAPPPGRRLTVVGIGASAGGLEALSTFFEAMSAESGLAFVVIVHLDPTRESVLHELLQQYTKMPVLQVTTMVPLHANRVYVVPPNKRLLVTDGHLDVAEFDEPRGQRKPIDSFFRSLAAGDHECAAVVLTGGGTDGAVGVKAIKERGGLLLVQDPDEAGHNGMPYAAMATGLVDAVLPVRELATKLMQFFEVASVLPQDPEALSDLESDLLQRILAHVQITVGHDFTQYKRSTIWRRVQRRLQLQGYTSLLDYLNFLRTTPPEARALFNDLLIGVTNFFRDRDAWAALGEQVIPRLFEEKRAGDSVRVWAIGCATGEEAYTLAILLLEELARLGDVAREIDVQVFASDLDDVALLKAREGFYPAAIEADVGPERLDRFFVKDGDYYRVRRELRDRVLFTNHSVLRDPPFSRLDLISCRNLLIYLQRPLQENIFEIFHYALRAGGYLFLGSAESADGVYQLFRVVDKQHRLYQARPWRGERPNIPALPLMTQRPLPRIMDSLQASSAMIIPPRAAAELHRTSLEQENPPSVLVDAGYHILHLSESVGRYLHLPRGPVSRDILKLVRTELQADLHAALFHAFETGRQVVSFPIPVRFNGHPHRVTMVVRPQTAASEALEEVRLALVYFLENEMDEVAGALPVDEGGGTGRGRGSAAQRELVVQLQGEVRHLRERLQATVEGHESSAEELKAANEELQSINEEYRSTTEELETSKEELQSVNEELHTVNSELKHKLEEVSRAHNDLENLMAATEIATLFLDRMLRIQWYTPDLKGLFHVMQGDRGRPIGHLTRRIDYPALEADAAQVLRTLTPIERTARSQAGAWYSVRLRPYRTVDDRIDGVVLTFIDITDRKRFEDELRVSQQRLADELVVIQQLHQMTLDVMGAPSQQSALDTIVRSTILLLGADYGEMQLLDGEGGTLVRATQQIFAQPGLDALRSALPVDDTLGSLALRTQQRIEIEDTDGGEIPASARELARNAGYRAAQATPLIGRGGKSLGALSTYYRMPHSLSRRDRRLLDLLARQASDLIDWLVSDGALRQRERELATLNETLEEQVDQRTLQVQQLAASLTMVEQEERERVAQILHDDLQQLLYAQLVQLQIVRETLGGAVPSALNPTIDAIMEHLREAVRVTRELATELNPPLLHTDRVGAGLAWLAEYMEEVHGLSVQLTLEEGCEPESLAVRTMLVGMARELLFNVIKHAGTGRARLYLTTEAGWLRLTVEDDGRGFDEGTTMVPPLRGLGLRYIAERVRLLGGQLELDVRPGVGSRITIVVPCRAPGGQSSLPGRSRAPSDLAG